MLNYIKSEWFRATHSKEIYCITGIISALLVSMNIVLFVADKLITDFSYAIVSFSLNSLIGSLSWMFVGGLLITGLLFADERKNRTLKNCISYGISRESIFAGKCIVCIGLSFISLFIILICYIGSACLLLEGEVLIPIQKMLGGILAAMPNAVASVILAIMLWGICSKEIVAILWWAVVMCFIPQVCFYLGLKFAVFERIAEWMPWNFFKYEVVANMSGYNCLWETSDGLFKCIVSGVVGILIFGLIGITKGKKQEF